MRRNKEDQPATIAMTGKRRIAFVFLGVLLLCFGVGNLAAGKLQYGNWWGGTVFAPFAVALGVLFIVVAVVPRKS